MTRYEGARPADGGPPQVRVHRPGGAVEPLGHVARHSPDGFQWGYGGSGPADLALAILWDHLGWEPEKSVYMPFKFEFVAKFGDSWSLTSDEIEAWLQTRRDEAWRKGR